jgi:hypothetical protein
LNHSARARRRSSVRRRNATGVAVGVLAVLVLIVTSIFVRYSGEPPSSQIVLNSNFKLATASQSLVTLAQETIPPAALGRSQREVYPYSVVPGGVKTTQELREATNRDEVVSAHYEGFDFSKARVIQVRQAKLVYVSYRIGGNIFWTRKRLSLQVGEKLITDGKTTARTRCGNQVSVVPHVVTSPDEPSLEALDRVIAAPVAPPIPFESALLKSPEFEARAQPPLGGGFSPGLPGPSPIGGGGCGSGRSCFTPPTSGPPPINMADPDAPSLLGSLGLFWIGVAGVCFHRWKIRRERSAVSTQHSVHGN